MTIPLSPPRQTFTRLAAGPRHTSLECFLLLTVRLQFRVLHVTIS
jgi:hypothetical protein